MKSKLLVTTILITLLLLVASAAFAQNDSILMRMWHISGSEGQLSAESLNPIQPGIFLNGHIEHMDSRLSLQGGGFELRSGFPAGIAPVERKLYLPVVENPEPTQRPVPTRPPTATPRPTRGVSNP